MPETINPVAYRIFAFFGLATLALFSGWAIQFFTSPVRDLVLPVGSAYDFGGATLTIDRITPSVCRENLPDCTRGVTVELRVRGGEFEIFREYLTLPGESFVRASGLAIELFGVSADFTRARVRLISNVL